MSGTGASRIGRVRLLVVVAGAVGGAVALLSWPRHSRDPVEAARESAANRMGFSAYGLSQGGDDPLVKALHGLIDHADKQQREIDRLVAALHRHGISVDEVSAERPTVDANELNRLVDE